MPKEITHWLIAEQAALLLEGSGLGKDIAAHPNCLRLGAVFPDILFFMTGKGPGARFRRLADGMHGSEGEDTYALLRGLLSDPIEAAYAGPLAAFWVGVATHIRADMRFHPLVYFLTGHYHHPDPIIRMRAVQQHRRFETMMDMYFLVEFNQDPARHSLRAILGGLELPLPYLLKKTAQEMASSRHETVETENALRRALQTFVTIQDLTCRRSLGRILYAVEKMLPGAARELTAIFQAPQLTAQFVRLRTEMTYLHPVTGEEGKTTVDELFKQAARDGADFCQRSEEAVMTREPGKLSERGPSLSFGLPGTTIHDARYFAIAPHVW